LADRRSALAHHFDDLQQQQEASSLGMWVFLATEIMFFGGLFVSYTVYRFLFPEAWAAGSHETDLLLGSVNTVVLIGSSLTMALAVYYAQAGKRWALIWFLILTIILGCAFLGIKGLEYYHKFVEHHIPGPDFRYPGPLAREVSLFVLFYFFMTGMHAVHMVIGIGLLAALIIRAWRCHFSPEYFSPVEMTGLYWHFVDIIWIFLFPLLYLIDRHK
jgi:cytochrome c oxidase subunit III